ncbi:hypothetical protein POM88_035346 [Heracleum sosnowskyi]|uniref:DUF1421 domain-containing protein n=1 Tax=Heracleum sosnowskyi TaxID=360622 RepID=A0AAD8HMW2_9APIA|nr:hypothetical protein POM88_035346 [Heracleum sosnowskyi]
MKNYIYSQQPPKNVTPAQGYYLPSVQLSNSPSSMQPSHGQILPSNSQYQTQPQPAQSQVNQTPQNHSLPQYQQQWSQQIPQRGQQQQHQTSMQPQIRPTSPAVDPPQYMPNVMPYAYGGVSRPAQPQPQPQPQPPPPHQHLKASFGAQPGDGYNASGPHQTLSSGNAYMTSNMMPRPPQFMRNHPYNELVEKMVSMGYRGEHVAGVIQRLEESGQPVDFNARCARQVETCMGTEGSPLRMGYIISTISAQNNKNKVILVEFRNETPLSFVAQFMLTRTAKLLPNTPILSAAEINEFIGVKFFLNECRIAAMDAQTIVLGSEQHIVDLVKKTDLKRSKKFQLEDRLFSVSSVSSPAISLLQEFSWNMTIPMEKTSDNPSSEPSGNPLRERIQRLYNQRLYRQLSG